MTRHDLLLLLVLVALAAVAWAYAADAPLVPNDIQKLKLENAQLRARLALTAVREAQEDYNAAMQTLRVACLDVVRENKWPEGTTCNFDTLAFAAPEPKAEEKKGNPK